MRDLHLSLNQTQRVRFQAALQQLEALSSRSQYAASSVVAVADTIPVEHEDNILKGHGTMELDGKIVATMCGVVERVNKLVSVRSHRARYKPDTGDIIVGRVVEIFSKCWKLETNSAQHAVLMLSSMNLPDGNQRKRTAVDELNMRSIFKENDVVCAEVREVKHDGSFNLQARSQKYGKLERGQLLTVPAYLVKRRKQHFHHLEQYGIDLILGCNGYIWVGQHIEGGERNKMLEGQENRPTVEEEDQTYVPLAIRKHICRMSNAIRVLSALGFTLTVESIIETAEASSSSNIKIYDMLGAEFHVQTAEREVQRRASTTTKKGRF